MSHHHSWSKICFSWIHCSPTLFPSILFWSQELECFSSYVSQILFFFLRFYLFIHERHRERWRHRQREKQAPYGEPDVGLNPRTPGSWPEPKADAQPLSHLGVPDLIILLQTLQWLLFPLRVKAKSLREALAPQLPLCPQHLLFCPVLTLLWKRHTADFRASVLLFLLPRMIFPDIHMALSFTSWLLLKYHFLNEAALRQPV